MLIKNATLCDANGEREGSIRITNGKISEIGVNLSEVGETEIIDAQGKTVLPAFVDLHCHFRTPGFEYKEDLFTGSLAAAAGGYTLVNCMANTKPVCSNSEIAIDVMRQAEEIGLCSVNQTVSITKDFDGKTLTHLDALPDELKIISDDGKGVQSALTMLEAMELAERKGLVIMSHAEDMELSPIDYRLAEDLETIRNLELCKKTGARLHMSHVSTHGALAAIERAKAKGVRVTCEVAPHHIWFSESEYRVNPPIREKSDVQFLINAIKRGSVDAIATDHAPHTDEEKLNGAPGMVGLETAFSVCYTRLCHENALPLSQLSAMLSKNPAKILNVNKGLLQVGLDGDIVIVDTKKVYNFNKSSLHSKSKNTPFNGAHLRGKVLMTIKSGKITYKEEGENL